MKTRLLLVTAVILLLLAFISPLYAQEIPSLPHAFCGTVTINGNPAPTNTTIEARGTNIQTGVEGNPIVTTVTGFYGSSEPLGNRLVVQGDITDGTTINFFINGIKSDQTAAWHSGSISELNLTVTTGDGGGDTTTDLEIIITRYADDIATVITQTTVSLAQMKSMSVQGNGVTHYYHQGPSFDQDNLWDEGETVNLKDQGAVKGTDLKDLCNLVGGMSEGDTVEIKAVDGFHKIFDYDNIYNPETRQGKMVVCWYNQEQGEGQDLWDAPELVFFAQTTNIDGKYVFGNWDMHETMPEDRWHYYYNNSDGVFYPSSNGYTVKNINRISIFSQESATTPTPATPTPSQNEGNGGGTTPTPTPTATSTPVLISTSTPTYTSTPTPATTPEETGVPTATPSSTSALTTPTPAPTPLPVYLTATTSTPLDLSGVIDENGIAKNAIDINFSDLGAELTIAQGATALTADGSPMQSITAQPVEQTPAPLPDSHIIGLAYDFEPSGATFDPPANLTIPYDPALLPNGVSENSLVIAYYDTQAGDWIQLNCKADTISHQITAEVRHFTIFAVLGKTATPSSSSEFNWTLGGVIIGTSAIVVAAGTCFLVIRRRKSAAD